VSTEDKAGVIFLASTTHWEPKLFKFFSNLRNLRFKFSKSGLTCTPWKRIVNAKGPRLCLVLASFVNQKTIIAMNPSRISDKTLLGKAIRLPFRLVPKGAVVPIVQGPARGKRWVSSSAAHSYWLGYWGLETQRSFAARLRPGDVVYDIGAHLGLYMLGSSVKVGPEGHVFAFEPLPRNVQYLRRHLELNQLSNCSVIEAAVCNSAGWRQLDASACHSEARLSETGSTTVPAVSIDEFLAGEPARRPPNVMKIDARGAEMEILCGGGHTVRNFAPRIFLFSYADNENRQCREYLSSLGYSLQQVTADAAWAERKR
jgi:FkbM family methyltransferase